MKIGTFEDRIKVETKRRFSSLWASMLDDFNEESEPEIDKRIVDGIRRGLLDSLQEVTEWINAHDVRRLPAGNVHLKRRPRKAEGPE